MKKIIFTFLLIGLVNQNMFSQDFESFKNFYQNNIYLQAGAQFQNNKVEENVNPQQTDNFGFGLGYVFRLGLKSQIDVSAIYKFNSDVELFDENPSLVDYKIDIPVQFSYLLIRKNTSVIGKDNDFTNNIAGLRAKLGPYISIKGPSGVFKPTYGIIFNLAYAIKAWEIGLVYQRDLNSLQFKDSSSQNLGKIDSFGFYANFNLFSF
jgi:hypothetical protein